MRFEDIAVPEVYTQESADFRLFLRWIQLCFEKTKYDHENFIDLYDPQRCRSDLLWLLGATMGFKYDDRVTPAVNRLILLYFMSMIRLKGSKDGVTLAAEVNLAQFNIIEYGKEKEILNNRLEDTSIPVNSVSEVEEKSLEELLDELNNLIGLKNVKSKVNDLIAFHKVQQLRKKAELPIPRHTMHMAFTGNPGTGKTTVARIVGRMYKQLGLLSKGHFIEVSRTDLIAGYQGQTALKVKKVIDKAIGGVLFIDEAYSITENEHSDSYGRECLTELTKALEDYRNDLVVIVAGYTEPMRNFFNSNPGLKSRFNTFIEFDNYNVEELIEILNSMCKKDEYILTEDVSMDIQKHLNEILSTNINQFANGRFMRNIYEDMIINHAKRVISITNPTKKQLQEFISDDIPINVFG